MQSKSILCFYAMENAFHALGDIILAVKLYKFGLCGLFLHLLQSYLRYRTFKVEVGNNIHRRIPNKTVFWTLLPSLNGTLFIIAVNEVISHIQSPFNRRASGSQTIWAFTHANSNTTTELKEFWNSWLTVSTVGFQPFVSPHPSPIKYSYRNDSSEPRFHFRSSIVQAFQLSKQPDS